MSDQEQEKNIAQGLSQLGETTTAAELLRQKGQTKKLRVITEKQLMDWILKLMQQHMAGKADAFSDSEKEEMLKKAQDEINRRVKREQEAQAERDRLKADLDAAMAAVSQAQAGAASQADIDAAMQGLKEKLEQAEQINLDLQQDNYDLQDQLNEKMALLSTTIAEKDKLRDTVRNQMMRMTSLVEGVIGIDNEYYGAKHQDENQVTDDSSQDEQFYHDFDIGAKVITTLQADLERLRGITKRSTEEQERKDSLLASDLELLEQLKSGSLHAVDVAAPVAGLVEALDGARAEAEAFESQVAEATGAGHQQSFTELPDASGEAAQVLAGATQVARELAASLARNRNRIAALKAIADESDEARHGTEEDLDATRAALDQVCTALRQRAEADRIAVPEALADREAAPADRAAAASGIVDHLQGVSPVEAAAFEQLAITDRLVKTTASPIDAKSADKHLVAERLRKAGQELERYTLDLQRQLDEALRRERVLSEHVRVVAIAQASAATGELQLDGPTLSLAVRELERSLEVKADPQFLAEVTAKALDEIANQGGKRAALQAVFAEDQAIAAEIVKASAGDAGMADAVADLAVAAEETDPAAHPDLSRLVRDAVIALASRKQEAEARAKAVEERLDAVLAEHGAGSAQVAKIAAELEAVRAEAQKLAGDAQRLRSGRDQAVGALDAITNEIRVRCIGCGKHPRPDLTDHATDPAQRSEAALAALAEITEHRAAESAAIDGVAAIDRALVRSGTAGGHAAGLVPGDEKRTAGALKEASAALEARVAAIADELDAARSRERDLAKQVRELSTALSVSSPSSTPKEEVARLERALAENAGPAELAEATRKVVAGLKAKAGKAEAEARAAAARAIAAEVVRATEGDVELADHAADLSLAIENPESDLAEIEGMVRETVVRLGSRRRAAEVERARLAAEIAKRDQRVAERGAETTRLSNEGARLKAHNAALTVALSQIAAELHSRATALGHEVPAILADPNADAEARVRAGREVLTGLAEHRVIEAAALNHLQAAERILAQTDGPTSGLTEGLRAGDEQAVAERLHKADGVLDAHVRDLHQLYEAANARERELARQVRDLATAQALASPGSVQRDDLTRLERALAEAGNGGDLAEATSTVVAGLKANAGKAEAEARSATARLIASEVVKAAEGDPSLADSVSALADANAGDRGMESSVREAVLKLAARKRALETERGRLTGELESVRIDRVAAIARAENAENARRDEVERLATELALTKERQVEAEAEVADFRARGDASSTHFSGEVGSLRQELAQIRQRHQEQTSNLATLRQSVEASEARLKRQREELNKRLEERDNLLAEKDRTIDQLSAQRTDSKALEAKVQALTVELGSANDRLRELELRFGDKAGDAVRSGDLADAQRRATSERDQLRNQKRQIEGELAEAQGAVDELRTELGELKKLSQAQDEEHARELAVERERNNQIKEELRKFKEEVVGLRANLRKRNEGGKA